MLSNKMIGLDDEFDRLVQIVERMKEEVANAEMRLEASHDQAEEAKNVGCLSDLDGWTEGWKGNGADNISFSSTFKLNRMI